jgi:hypothetical protein
MYVDALFEWFQTLFYTLRVSISNSSMQECSHMPACWIKRSCPEGVDARMGFNIPLLKVRTEIRL